MTSDILLISVSKDTKNYRETSKKMISILLVKRNDFPSKNKWCLTVGFLNPKNETNLSYIYLEQLCTFDDIKRDLRTHVASTAYISLVYKNKFTHKLNKNAFWFDITEFKEIGM